MLIIIAVISTWLGAPTCSLPLLFKFIFEGVALDRKIKSSKKMNNDKRSDSNMKNEKIWFTVKGASGVS